MSGDHLPPLASGSGGGSRFGPRSLIVGRDHEQALLNNLLNEAQSGHGQLVLVSGEAGIGKTALVSTLGAAAADNDWLVLTGACYDAGTSPPYGPWREITRMARRHGDLPDVSAQLRDRELLAQVPNPVTVISELEAWLVALLDRGPLLLILEDLHWADPESLAFLRHIARQAAEWPLLLVTTYRADELVLRSGLDQLLPHLVRESNAQRIHLRPLNKPAMLALVAERYVLPQADTARLAAYLGSRSQGIPLYLVELLRSLEEEQRLHQDEHGWTLGEIDVSHVPALVRQVIDSRVARLGAAVRRVLELGAVIGQEVPLLLWRRVSGASDDLFDETIERAVEAHLLESTPSALHLRFSHALVRDALYEGLSLSRRQSWHRQVAEALEPETEAEPETIAQHFRQALDPRAVEWFIRAGSRIERVAWLTAASHFEAALSMMNASDPDLGARGWLLLRRAKLLRGTQPQTSLAILDTVGAIADDAQDSLLQTYMLVYRGEIRCTIGEVRMGLTDLEASITGLTQLAPTDLERLDELERQHIVLNRSNVTGMLASNLAYVGRIDEALAQADAIIEHADGTPMLAWWGRAIALALAGKVNEANEAYATCADEMLRVSADGAAAILLLQQLSIAQIPYGADNLAERQRIAAAGEAAWRSSRGSHDVPPRIAWLPLLQVKGEWQAARQLALSSVQLADATSERHLASTVVLAQVARAQGEVSFAWEQVNAILRGGPQTLPGYVDLVPSLALIRVAVGLCLDRDDLVAAHAWLDAHDRWLAWSGAVLGRADGMCAWASYFLATGDVTRAHHYADQAFALASEPRQPLILLTAHRLLGLVDAHLGKIPDSRQHLDAALTLADACVAPFERALTLLDCVDLSLRSGAIEQASAELDEARAICMPLAAAPTLARIDALAARLSNQSNAMERTAPAGLSPREIEVLRLLASGRTNREIAETLFLSVRTIERHLTNLYTKINAQNRAEAIAFAHEHSLT